MSPRTFFVGGNFKMNGSKELVVKLLTDLKNADREKNVEIVMGVPFPYLDVASKTVEGSPIEIAAENAYLKNSGAFTGEVSPAMIKDCGATWVILGHSERRHIFHETDDDIAAKAKFAIENGLQVIYCIGETKDQREANKTMDVNNAQVEALVKVLSAEQWKSVVLAYEPVWAIGTGLTATPADAQAVHESLRKSLSGKVNKEVAEKTRILYGGSVTGSTCGDLSSCSDIDGFLVGGASLKPEFHDIVNSARVSK